MLLATFRKLTMLLFLLLAGKAGAQVFWTEVFSNGCSSLCTVSSYTTGPNGAWTLVSTGTNDASANQWFVSGSECGNGAGQCGTSCASIDPSLHVSNVSTSPSAFFFCPSGDCGAAYDAGWGSNAVRTNKRAESPVIDCSGKSTITLAFNYIEGGSGNNDNATLLYFDGTIWTQIDGLAKTTNTGCSGQGKWTAFSINMPVSANNNPNVQIGFQWVNNDDGAGNDPSFALDDITLSAETTNTLETSTVSPNRFCAGAAIQVSYTSTGTFAAGNIFTAQISDASGSFASPIDIGSLSSTANSGSISGVIPDGLSTGTGYLIRVVSSNPVVVSTVTTSVVILALPADPTLLPDQVCEETTPQFTAGNGSLYEFLIDGVSQGEMSATNTFMPESGLHEGTEFCVRSYPPMPFTFDGLLDEPEWGLPLATSEGGAVSSFGQYNRIDAVYLSNDPSYLYGAIAGDEENTDGVNNRVFLFIDSKPGGFNKLSDWVNRSNTPYVSLERLSKQIIFDAGFEPDYILAMNQSGFSGFYDLYDMASDASVYLNALVGAGYYGMFGNGNEPVATLYKRGFEFAIPNALLGNPVGTIKVFAMLVNDPGQFTTDTTMLSNQFLTRANNGESNYGNGFVDFNAAAPDPITYTLEALCYSETCITVQPLVDPVFDPIGPLCVGELLPPGPFFPEISKNGLSGTWSGVPSTDIPGDFDFTFTPDNPCANSKTITITIKPLPTTSTIFHD